MMKAFVSALVLLSSAFSMEGAKVVVTGAAGRTGSIVFKKLLASSDFTTVGLVRSQSSFKKLKSLGAKEENIVEADVTDTNCLADAFAGADSVILCTSAVPKFKTFSIVKVLLSKLTGQSARPEFYFAPNGDPYNVDWLGAKNQIDAAKKAGVKRFVFLGSMGGTQDDNFLNTIGRVEGEELSGNILIWKRKAEKHLIASGLKYTIIHPGGLLDAEGGKREILRGVDDKFLELNVRNIPREDVAEVIVQSLRQNGAVKKSFDIIAPEPAPNGENFEMDWKKFFSQTASCKY